ncbi:hypothetical protein [Arenibacter certesii]|uniref:DUF455 family protein n=1 Tax=Arenibacter certesii TaxID=228955 RepID=A0A918MKT8_9FLAO|nr:hypothetical protein [Arenibacter certesii]GGW36077.1 hypothetical protein GCM10007383_21240 [Arenibacter certesii]
MKKFDNSSYLGYKGLPPFADLLSVEDALEKGQTTEESVDQLKRYHWALKRLSRIFTNRITAMPIYELKMAFGLHAHLCAEHVNSVHERVREMREPPYGLDSTPDEYLDLLLDEIQCAPSTEALVLGLYEKVIPALVRGLENSLEQINKLFEHPTYRVLRFALLEIMDIQNYGKKTLESLIKETHKNELLPWLIFLDQCLEASGDLDGTKTRVNHELSPYFSKTPYKYDPIPQRDERFIDKYNMGVNAEAFLLDTEQPHFPKLIMLYFKRLREIDVPEMMASIIEETKDKPWSYYKDMIRQLWDESRHAMMGELGFISLGIDWTKIPITWNWSYQLNTKCTPKERHAILFFIEQGLMPAKTGKQYEWEVALATENQLAKLIQDYDWADEVLHAKIGREWIVPEIGGQKQTMEFGSCAWDKAYEDWGKWKEEGLTEHQNWWPKVYSDTCGKMGVVPDPKVLAYNVSYEDARADQKMLKKY